MRRKKRPYRREGRYLFVDGYNIINHWEDLAFLVEIDLEQAREKLIEILWEYAHIEKIYLILVFDAYKIKGNEGSIIHREGMEVVYTKEGETADHYIERQLHIMGKVREVSVATSDHIEQQLIMARGGRRISARELELDVKNSQSMVRLEAKRLVKGDKTLQNTIDEETLKQLQKIKRKLD